MRLGAALVVAALSSSLTYDAHADEAYVIPPGREALLGKMLGDGKVTLAGCRFDGASIRQTIVEARYLCGKRTVPVRLSHASEAPADAEKTAKFAVHAPAEAKAPAGLVHEIAERVRANEAGFEWGDGRATAHSARPLPELEDLLPISLRADSEGGTDESFAAARALYDDRQFGEAADAFLALARRSPSPQVLAMLYVASNAEHPTVERAEARAKAADAAAGEPALAFAAGLALELAASQSVDDPSVREKLLERAVAYLGRAREGYASNPSVLVALALGQLRLGRISDASDLAKKAVAAAPGDPGGHYALALASRDADAKQALVELDAFVKLSGGRESFDDEPWVKLSRVREELDQRARGVNTHPSGSRVSRRGRVIALIAAGFAALLASRWFAKKKPATASADGAPVAAAPQGDAASVTPGEPPPAGDEPTPKS